MPHSSREPITCPPHRCQVIEGGLTRTDPPSPRASLPTWAKQGIRDRRDSKVSQTARPGQTGLGTFNPPTGEDGRPRRPHVVYLLSPHPFSHHRLSGLHGNPAGSAPSPGEVGPPTARPPPSFLAATWLPRPSQGGPGLPLSICSAPPPPEVCGAGGNFRGTWAKEKQALGSKRTFLEKGG